MQFACMILARPSHEHEHSAHVYPRLMFIDTVDTIELPHAGQPNPRQGGGNISGRSPRHERHRHLSRPFLELERYCASRSCETPTSFPTMVRMWRVGCVGGFEMSPGPPIVPPRNPGRLSESWRLSSLQRHVPSAGFSCSTSLGWQVPMPTRSPQAESVNLGRCSPW